MSIDTGALDGSTTVGSGGTGSSWGLLKRNLYIKNELNLYFWSKYQYFLTSPGSM